MVDYDHLRFPGLRVDYFRKLQKPLLHCVVTASSWRCLLLARLAYGKCSHAVLDALHVGENAVLIRSSVGRSNQKRQENGDEYLGHGNGRGLKVHQCRLESSNRGVYYDNYHGVTI